MEAVPNVGRGLAAPNSFRRRRHDALSRRRVTPSRTADPRLNRGALGDLLVPGNDLVGAIGKLIDIGRTSTGNVGELHRIVESAFLIDDSLKVDIDLLARLHPTTDDPTVGHVEVATGGC